MRRFLFACLCFIFALGWNYLGDFDNNTNAIIVHIYNAAMLIIGAGWKREK